MGTRCSEVAIAIAAEAFGLEWGPRSTTNHSRRGDASWEDVLVSGDGGHQLLEGTARLESQDASGQRKTGKESLTIRAFGASFKVTVVGRIWRSAALDTARVRVYCS